MAFTIKLPRVANRRQTLAQDYNWPKRSAPTFMATRAGAVAMPVPITPRFASTAASMWQPASVNATMLPGFYKENRMGNEVVSNVVRNFGSVPMANFRPTNLSGLGGLGAYYDLGVVDTSGITITATVVKSGNTTILKPSSGPPITVYNPSACAIPTVLVRNGVATPEYRAFIACNAAQAKLQPPIAQTPTTDQRRAASEARIALQRAPKLARVAEITARQAKEQEARKATLIAAAAKKDAAAAAAEVARRQAPNVPAGQAAYDKTWETVMATPGPVTPQVASAAIAAATQPLTEVIYNHSSYSTPQASGPVAAVMAAVQSAVTGSKPSSSSGGGSGGGGGGGGSIDSTAVEEPLLPNMSINVASSGLDVKRIALFGAVGLGAWFAYKTFFKKGR